MLKLNLLGIHTIHSIHLTAWLEPWTMLRKGRFVLSKVYSSEHSFYRIIISVMPVKSSRIIWNF